MVICIISGRLPFR